MTPVTAAEDRLPIIESCADGLHRGLAEPLFIGDIDWLIGEVKQLRGDLERAQARIRELEST